MFCVLVGEIMQGGDKVIYKQLSYDVVGVLYSVYNDLGYGYSEKIYEKAVARCFDEKMIRYKRQISYGVLYKGKVIGKNLLDFIIEDKIVLELKRGDYFSKNNIEQIKKYLAVTKMQLAILAHFTSSGVKIFRAFNINNLK